MKTKPVEITYTEAFEELNRLVLEMERGEIAVDVLSEKVARAGLLIKICKAKLTETEASVSALLKELE